MVSGWSNLFDWGWVKSENTIDFTIVEMWKNDNVILPKLSDLFLAEGAIYTVVT